MSPLDFMIPLKILQFFLDLSGKGTKEQIGNVRQFIEKVGKFNFDTIAWEPLWLTILPILRS